MRIFVAGATGQVARSLEAAARRAPDVILVTAGRPQVDLLQPQSIARAIGAFAPDLVVNAAAYTAVDRAEAEPEIAFAVNGKGAGAVAAAAAAAGAPVVHLSTDYVFDGAKPTPYVETDLPAPQGVYGRSKLEGEQAVAAANPRCVIFRTAWVYAPFGANFVLTMLRLGRERPHLRVVDDQVGCPTYAPDIAAAVLAVARRIGAAGWRDQYSGVTHLAGPDAVSWCGFARAILAGAAARGRGPAPEVEAIATADYPTPARRPANSRLATGRLSELFGLALPPLADSLGRCLDQLAPPLRAEAGPLR